MKKIIIALLFVLILSHTVFAATSADVYDNVYLRQDVFEAKMDAFMAEIKLMNQNMRSEFKQDINELSKAIAVLSERTDRNFDTLSARIDGVNSHIDDLRNGMYLWLVVIATLVSIIAVVITWPRVKNFLELQKETRNQRNSLTIEEVERLVERIIDARLNAKSQS